jgi:hypothetical protein
LNDDKPDLPFGLILYRNENKHVTRQWIPNNLEEYSGTLGKPD